MTLTRFQSQETVQESKVTVRKLNFVVLKVAVLPTAQKKKKKRFFLFPLLCSIKELIFFF